MTAEPAEVVTVFLAALGTSLRPKDLARWFTPSAVAQDMMKAPQPALAAFTADGPVQRGSRLK